jgi:hypothetical protein
MNHQRSTVDTLLSELEWRMAHIIPLESSRRMQARSSPAPLISCYLSPPTTPPTEDLPHVHVKGIWRARYQPRCSFLPGPTDRSDSTGVTPAISLDMFARCRTLLYSATPVDYQGSWLS